MAVAAAQLVSAAVFLLTVRRPVFDEPNYKLDVGRYEREGISVASIRAHESPAGPGMTILASLGGRAVPGSVVARRIPMFVAWLVAVGLLIALCYQRPGDAAVPIAGVLILVFPHTPISAATLLTEGPATACVMAALWISGLLRTDPSAGGSTYRALLAGLFVGLALCFRQYYLALVPAFALAWWTDRARLQKWELFLVGPLASLAGYFYVWGGLTSAAARAGTTFGYRAHLGFDFLRPFSALAYVGIYALPLLAGEWQGASSRRRGALAAGGTLTGAVVTTSGNSVWGNGPLWTILASIGRARPVLGHVANWLLTSVAFLGVLLLASLIWKSGRRRSLEPFAILCTSFLVFFGLEQAGVGGTIPYYERYAHQTVFFASALSATLAPPRTYVLLTCVAVLLVEGQWILWRHALMG